MKRSKTIPFINTSDTTTADYARIGKSTVFDLVLNPQTEENDFIESDLTQTDVMSYKPQLDQELQCNKGDDAFDYLYDMFYNLPTGEDVKKNLMLVFDGATTITPPSGDPYDQYKAWDCDATLTLDHFDSVAEKIYFSFSINSITRCNVKIDGGVPVIDA